MICSDITAMLDNRIVSQLGETERRQVEAHLGGCRDCARDWELHTNFAALPDMVEPGSFAALCRARIASSSLATPRQRARSHWVLLGTFVVIAAAAAVLAVTLHSPQRSTPAVSHTAFSPPEAIDNESRTSIVESVAYPPDVKAPVPAPSTAPTQLSPSFTVRVLPLQNTASGAAASTAVDSFYALVLDGLRAVNGITLMEPNSTGFEPDAPASFELRIQGHGEGGRYGVGLSASRVTTGKPAPFSGVNMSWSGDVTSSCNESAALAARYYCSTPVALAARVLKTLRTTLFPFDPVLQQQLEKQMLDAKLDSQQRLMALDDLRAMQQRANAGTAGQAGPEGRNWPRDPAIVRGAIDLAAASDPEVRAAVWSALRESREPSFVKPLVASLQQDADPRVRVEALATLSASFADSPDARAGMEAVATEGRPLLRALARRALSGNDAWHEQIAASLKDKSLSDPERFEALGYFANQPGPTPGSYSPVSAPLLRKVLDGDAIRALADVLPGAAIPTWMMGSYLRMFGEIEDPAMTDLFLRMLNLRVDAATRQVVLSQLVRRRAEPGVRQALERIAADDSDPQLRELANQALRPQAPAP